MTTIASMQAQINANPQTKAKLEALRAVIAAKRPSAQQLTQIVKAVARETGYTQAQVRQVLTCAA